MAKVQIKYEKLTPFGGFFLISLDFRGKTIRSAMRMCYSCALTTGKMFFTITTITNLVVH